MSVYCEIFTQWAYQFVEQNNSMLLNIHNLFMYYKQKSNLVYIRCPATNPQGEYLKAFQYTAVYTI